jgi:hypothetical protein
MVFLGSCYSILLFDLGPGQESSSSELRHRSQIWIHAIAKVREYLPMLHGYFIFNDLQFQVFENLRIKEPLVWVISNPSKSCQVF